MIDRRRKLAIIHVAKKECGLDDESYRALLFSTAGVESAADLKTESQYREIMSAFKKLGFRYNKGRKKKIQDPQMAKCYALWCSLHESGAVRDKRYSALRSWIKRQVGSDQEILTGLQMSKLIEDLKAWLVRVEGQDDGNSGLDD